MGEPRIFLERVPAKTLKVGDRFIEDEPFWPVEQVLHDSANWTHIDGADCVWELHGDSTVLKVVTP